MSRLENRSSKSGADAVSVLILAEEGTCAGRPTPGQVQIPEKLANPWWITTFGRRSRHSRYLGGPTLLRPLRPRGGEAGVAGAVRQA